MKFTTVAILPSVAQRSWFNHLDLELPASIQDKFCHVSLQGDSFLGSFEGSAYENFISNVTSHSLTEEYIPPEDVKDILMELESYSEFPGKSDIDVTNLVRFFDICAKNGLGVVRT